MIVTEISWDAMFDGQPLPDSPARAAWCAAVAEVAAKAKAALPVEVDGRIEQAVQIVLAGEVDLLPDGTATVASPGDGTTESFVVNGSCGCLDFSTAPSGWCLHRLSAAIAKRAYPLAKAKLDAGATGQATSVSQPTPAQPDAPTAPLPEAPVETPQSIPPQHVVLIQGRPFVKFAGLLQMAHERGLVSLTADWTANESALSLAHAVATFQDGRRFEESGDATPENTNRKVAPHFRRVALTRAKARVLRDALGVDLVAVEELSDSE